MTTQEMQIPELTLGWRLRMARECADIDQRPMAELLGVSQAAITQWERDQRRPRDLLDVVRRWSEITHVPISWLLGLDEPNRGIRSGHLSTDRKIATELRTLGLWLPDISHPLERVAPVPDTANYKHYAGDPARWFLSAA